MAGTEYNLSDFNRLAKESAKAFREAESGETLAESYIRCGDALQIAGVPKKQICAMVRESVEAELRQLYKDETVVFHSGHFYEVMGGKGWKRSYGTREDGSNEGDDESPAQENGNSSDSLNSFLAFDKRLDENGNIDEKQIPFYEYRYPYWKFFVDQAGLIDKLKKEIEKDYDTIVKESGKQEKVPRNYMKLYESQADMQSYQKALGDLYYNIADTAEKAIDNRQSILPYQLFPFLAKLSIITIKHFASKHYALIRAIFDITTKKTTQFVKDVNSISDLLESTMEDSWKWHFIDIKCPKCKTETLKPRMYDDGTWKFVCKNWKAHNKEEIEWSSDLLKHRINILSLNIGHGAEKYLKDRGIGDDKK